MRWFFILKAINLPIKIYDAFISCGLSIFTKYVPGKVLMILGKTSHIKQKYQYPADRLITASFNDQIIAIWTGLIVGSISLIHYSNKTLFISLLAGVIIFGFSIFNNSIYKLLKHLIKRISKKDADINIIPFSTLLKILPYHFLYWLLLGFGFFFLNKAINNANLAFAGIFAFPLSIVGGIVSIISPGGLGIREAILAYYFSSQMNNDSAITIASISRLWFLLGEVFIFTLGIIIQISKGRLKPISKK